MEYIDTLTEKEKGRLVEACKTMDKINKDVSTKGYATQVDRERFSAARDTLKGLEFYQMDAIKKAAGL